MLDAAETVLGYLRAQVFISVYSKNLRCRVDKKKIGISGRGAFS
jgi:hypothetical protein